MNYEEALEWMFAQIPMYQRQGKAAYKADLTTTEALDARMGHPHHSFRSIHVGGTNGKGSVSHMLASILHSAGYTTGLYTSPHLKDFRERIRVNGKLIRKDFVMDFLQHYNRYFQGLEPSFFEMTVAMAFEYFRTMQVDVAIVEVGMGGRLDSTNIIDPEVSVITNISLDHTQFLGNTVEEIAREKAGIIKKGRPVVVGEYDPQTSHVFRDKAALTQSLLCFANQYYRVNRWGDESHKACYSVIHNDEVVYDPLCTDLLGSYQAKNLVTCLMTADVMKEQGYDISAEHIRQGLANVSGNTGFAGRWFPLQRNPLVICDTAHNQAGLALNIAEVQRISRGGVHFVLGFVNDKQLEPILRLFPSSERYYFTKANIPRALNEKRLAEIAYDCGLKGEAFSSPRQALDAARKNAKEDDLVYVGGSTFLVSEVL